MHELSDFRFFCGCAYAIVSFPLSTHSLAVILLVIKKDSVLWGQECLLPGSSKPFPKATTLLLNDQEPKTRLAPVYFFHFICCVILSFIRWRGFQQISWNLKIEPG